MKYNCNTYMYMYISVYDKLIWHTIGPMSFLFGTAVLSLCQMAKLIMIIYHYRPALVCIYSIHVCNTVMHV